MSSARRAAFGLALLTVLALLVRQVGIDYGIPLWEEGDAHIHAHAELLRRGVESSRNRVDEIQYPSVLARTVALLPAIEPPPPGDGPAPLEAHLAAARGTFLQTRRVVSVLGALLVPLTYLLARRSAGRGWSLFAAALPAVDLLHVTFSQEARPHGAVATPFLLAVLLCLRLRARPTAGAYLACGLACALSVGSLHSGVMTLLPLAVAHWLAERPPGRSRWLEPRLLLALAPVALAVPCFYAFAFDDSVRETKHVFRVEGGHVYMANHKLSLEMWNGSGLASLGRILTSWTPELLLLLPLACAGLVLARRAQATAGGRGEPAAQRLARGELAVMLAFVLPYLALLAAYARTYERFLIPLLPYAGALAATGLERLGAVLAARGARWGPAAVRAAAAAGLLLPLGASLHWTWLRARPGTYELAGAWVREHVDPAAEHVWLTPPYDLPLVRTDEALRDEDGKRRGRVTSLWSKYQLRVEAGQLPGPRYDVRWLVAARSDGDLTDPARVEDFLDRHGPGVYVLEVARGARGSLAGERLAEGVARRGRRMQRFGPDPDPDSCDHPLADEDEEVEDWPGFFWRSLRARATGPVVEVWRVP